MNRSIGESMEVCWVMVRLVEAMGLPEGERSKIQVASKGSEAASVRTTRLRSC